MKNSFKEIPGYNGRYFIDRNGNIYSSYIKRTMKQRTVCGYKAVTLLHDNGKKFTGVHRLVYQTFVGQIPKKMEINHVDGNKSNNKLENLELVTSSENKLHAFRTGLKSLIGEKHNNLKLNNKSVLYIMSSKERGIDLAAKFNVGPSMICRIRKGKAWAHLREVSPKIAI